MSERKHLEGFGSIYRKSFKRKRADGTEYAYTSPNWTITYFHHGEELREQVDSTEERDALKLLKKRVQDLGRGIVGTKEERVSFEQLTDDLKNDYRVNGKRSLDSVELSISHLEKVFSGDKARFITTDRIRTYIAKRQAEGAANGSINRELSALKRSFSLAIEAGKLFHRPHIPMLEENNAREGFLDHAGFLALREELPDYLKDPVSFLYLSGWRSGEMKSLEWRDVGADAIRLRSENSKNKKPRVLPLRGELEEIVGRARQSRRVDCPFVFHSDGRPIGDFRKAWQRAVKAAGLGKLLIHDMRRSAVRNFIKAGIPEKVAMGLSGHQTRSVFDRYHIVSEDDLAAASERLFSHLESQAESAKVIPIRKVS